MTKTELRYHVFKAGDKAKYKGKIYKIASVDFQEYLLGLRMNISGDDPNDIIWVRCENVYFIGK